MDMTRDGKQILTRVYGIKPGTVIYYLCDTAREGSLRSHDVVAGPYLHDDEAIEAATDLWYFRGRIVMPGVVCTTMAHHRSKVALVPYGSYVLQRSEMDHGNATDHVAMDLERMAELLFNGEIRRSDRYMIDDNSSPVKTTYRVVCVEALVAWSESGLGREIRILGRVDDGETCSNDGQCKACCDEEPDPNAHNSCCHYAAMYNA